MDNIFCICHNSDCWHCWLSVALCTKICNLLRCLWWLGIYHGIVYRLILLLSVSVINRVTQTSQKSYEYGQEAYTQKHTHTYTRDVLQAAQYWSWLCSMKVDWLHPQWGSSGWLMLTLMGLVNTIHQSRTMGSESFSRSSCRGQIIRCCHSLNLQNCCHHYILRLSTEIVFCQYYKSPPALTHCCFVISAFYRPIKYFSDNPFIAKQRKSSLTYFVLWIHLYDHR